MTIDVQLYVYLDSVTAQNKLILGFVCVYPGNKQNGFFLIFNQYLLQQQESGKIKEDTYQEKLCDCFFIGASPGALTITKAGIPGGKQSARIRHEKYNTCISFEKDERNYGSSTRPNLRYLAESTVRFPLSYVIDSPDVTNC